MNRSLCVYGYIHVFIGFMNKGAKMLPFMEHALLLILCLAFFRDCTLSFGNLTFQLLYFCSSTKV